MCPVGVPVTLTPLARTPATGKLVTIKGNVVRVAGVRPLVKRMDFVCAKCGTTVTCQFVDGKYEPPNACPGAKCKSRSLLPDRRSAVTVDWQKIRCVGAVSHASRSTVAI